MRIKRAFERTLLVLLAATLSVPCAGRLQAVAQPAVAATSSPEPTGAQPPEVAALQAKIDAARGTRPVRERIVETISASGRAMTRTTVRDGKNVRITDGNGPFMTATGTFEGQQWHQNANGLTVLDQPRRGTEADERYTTALRHVTVPFVADVIVDLNAKGDGTKTYVDPATARIVRFDRISPTETTVTSYDDFRTSAGYTQAWHTHISDGQAPDERDERIVAITTNGISTADVAIAPPRRELVNFPAGTTTVSLPVRFDSAKFYVRVTIGTRAMDFMLDTGAGGIVMDRDVARSLGLPLSEVGSSAANAGRYTQSQTIVPLIDVGPLVMKDVAVVVVPNVQFASPNAPVRAVGLLGFDFIASLGLSLDYERGTVTATNYDAFKPPTDPATIVLPIRVGDDGPETDVAIDGHLGERFQIDTGGAGGVFILDVFTRRYPGLTREFLGGTPISMQGVGGSFPAKMYAVPSLRLGQTTFKNFSAIVVGSDRLYASHEFDGIVGPELLQYFTMTTDYADSTIYLTPNKLGKLAHSGG